MNVDLDLRCDDEFLSRSVIEFDCARGGFSFVDFKGRELTGATLNDAELPVTSWKDGRIPLPDLRAGRNTLTVTGVMDYSHDGEGLHRFVDPVDGRAYLYAMSFLDAAPRWFACFDQPDLKAPYRMGVSAPAEWVVFGNGPARRCRLSDDGETRDWCIQQPLPLATYFVTLVAGPWERVVMQYDDIPVTLVARQSLADELDRECADIFAVTEAAFDAYHDMFGVRYPYGSYTQAFVPDFNAGAMENPGCITLRDQMLLRGCPTELERAKRAVTISHEMAHQWFGDLVTMRWWDDLWLNESFAEYMGTRVVAGHTGYDAWTPFGIEREYWGVLAEQAPSAHPVAGNGAGDAQGALANFDGISYAKGAALLRQLATSLGDDVFLGGLRAYFDAHRFGNAALGDLLDAWRAAGASSIDAFAAEWLRTSGMDVVDVDADGRGLMLSLGRCGVTGPMTSGLTLDVAALDDTGRQIGRTTLRSVLPGHHRLAGMPRAAVYVPDAGATAWLRRSPSTWVLPPIAQVSDVAVRVVLHNAIRVAVRYCELPVAAALRLMKDGLPGEPNDNILVAMTGFAVDLAGTWSPWGARAGRTAEVAQLIEALLADDRLSPDETGDRRRLLSLALTRCTSDRAWLRSLLVPAVPGGEPADPELRWAAVTRLVALGDETSIVDAELAVDPAGADKAAGARAAAPTPEAKQAALDALLTPGDRRAYELYAIAENVWQAGQEQLSQPFVERWFAGIGATAAFRDGWALAGVASRSFPLAVAGAGTLPLAEATLADTIDDRLRRELADSIWTWRRVLAQH